MFVEIVKVWKSLTPLMQGSLQIKGLSVENVWLWKVILSDTIECIILQCNGEVSEIK